MPAGGSRPCPSGRTRTTTSGEHRDGVEGSAGLVPPSRPEHPRTPQILSPACSCQLSTWRRSPASPKQTGTASRCPPKPVPPTPRSPQGKPPPWRRKSRCRRRPGWGGTRPPLAPGAHRRARPPRGRRTRVLPSRPPGPIRSWHVSCRLSPPRRFLAGDGVGGGSSWSHWIPAPLFHGSLRGHLPPPGCALQPSVGFRGLRWGGCHHLQPCLRWIGVAPPELATHSSGPGDTPPATTTTTLTPPQAGLVMGRSQPSWLPPSCSAPPSLPGRSRVPGAPPSPLDPTALLCPQARSAT